MLAPKLRWVRMTPLGSPVVPDEYGNTSVLSDSTPADPVNGVPSALVKQSASSTQNTSCTDVPRAASFAVARSASEVRMNRAPESTSLRTFVSDSGGGPPKHCTVAYW